MRNRDKPLLTGLIYFIYLSLTARWQGRRPSSVTPAAPLAVPQQRAPGLAGVDQLIACEVTPAPARVIVRQEESIALQDDSPVFRSSGTTTP